MRYQGLGSVVAVCFALSMPTGAAAQPTFAIEGTRSAALKWEIGYLALSAADTAQTIECLNRGVCTEGNPLFGKHPKAGTLIAAKAAFGLAHFALFNHLSARDPHAGLRFAQGSVLMQGSVVMLNARFLF